MLIHSKFILLKLCLSMANNKVWHQPEGQCRALHTECQFKFKLKLKPKAMGTMTLARDNETKSDSKFNHKMKYYKFHNTIKKSYIQFYNSKLVD